ncbi:MAG: chemotaxis protein [Candidatus Dactylopiibacterium carminicum]|uniref:Chemotaxis protein n=1 Tax=Candidatus Dactylopiibacterium carminicum TaxID=857335 RepID=A0A272ETL6_9RHOO|nr:PAS domain-containing methyl-accepting chemotaxis protein [Candidatus Dactylopiibacterium carminicum]KAF7599401.1 chemotaxis protein [Candidatus Dactylopiibacterium carminicum]PAS93441.1 MAG: chemotaxis protein [Candidatus Dactylopiibacterium carminicum]PAS95960.1 MAG: chemotaxis protein [Candidatus Dactylopiibacterium carminicum]PAS99411.1 MAG: hypothetical protein BSR46_08070 [Candidatus Dactylopiibacterium carminicum]
MRINQPVTQRETLVPADTFIYSRTDLKGRITHANKAFADISGFAPEEMVGEPHNLIRHPDMPPAAFADMWVNLKAGRPWKGLVKNRRKDGGFYWVIANASPVREEGKIVGYQSVRTPPTRQQVKAAEQAYARLRAGDKRIRVQDGRIMPNHSAWFETLFSFQTALAVFVVLTLLISLITLISTPLATSWPGQVLQLGTLLLLPLGLYVLFWHLPRNNARLRAIRDFAEHALSSGDLCGDLNNARADLVGSISTRVDTLLSAMRATLQIVQDATREVSDATSSLNHSVETLVSAADTQSNATASAAAGVEEMTVSIGEVAQHADATHDLAQHAGDQAREGASLSEKATESIQTLASSVGRSAETVEQLGSRTDEIGQVAATIKEIADQTNLLALNAAIEAARAGEQGRGFAVVADEVRKLAERTAKATQEIDQMIMHIQIDTHNAVSGMRDSAGQVNASVDLVHRSHEALLAIREQMTTTAQQVADISHAAGEQNEAMLLMSRSVEQLAHLTDDNLSAAHGTESASHKLLDNVERMRKAVAQYHV